MYITEKKSKGIKSLELNGKVDADCQHFEKDMLELVENEDKIIIDCGRLDYINSMGLRAFLTTVKSVGKTNGRIVICNLQAHIKEIFDISGFTSLFDIYNDTETAVSSFN